MQICIDLLGAVCYNIKKLMLVEGRQDHIMPSIHEIMTAEFGFNDIKDLIFKVYTHPHIEGLLQPVRDFIDSLSPFAWGALICLIALIFTFFGKKLIMLPVLLGSYAVAYAVGATYIAPKLATLAEKLPFEVPIEIGVVGVIVGAVAALLCVPFYFAALSIGGGYAVHLLLYPIVSAFITGDVAMYISLGAAAVVAVLLLVFRKWTEMGATAVIGAYFFMLGVNEIMLLPLMANYAIWATVAVAGTVVQIKTRRRY